MAVIESGPVAARALDDLYRKHGAEVYRYAYAVLGNRADAEDVTQTTFLNAYRSLEQGVRPRKPANWLLTIASNAIKQRFRQEHGRPRHVELDERLAGPSDEDDDDGPTVGELLAALSKIPPQQRQAIVLREFEGRSYSEIAEILGVTTSALETLLFRARRSLAEELEHRLTCTQAQLAVSRAADGRLGRKERRRLRDHLGECPDCASFAGVQQRHRRALKGLMLVPIPLSLSVFKGMEGSAAAAALPVGAGAGMGALGAGAGSTAAGGGLLAGGAALKAAAVVSAAAVAGGVGVTGATQLDSDPPARRPPALAGKPGERLGQVAPRGVLVPGRGVARGKGDAPGQTKTAGAATGKGAAKRPARTRASGVTSARPKPAKRPAKPGVTTPRPKPAPARSQRPQETRTKEPAAPKGASASDDTTDETGSAASGRGGGAKAP